MSFNVFGEALRITTFGESHGPAVGVVLDGVAPGVPIDLAEIQRELDRRRPGKSPRGVKAGQRSIGKGNVVCSIFGVGPGPPGVMTEKELVVKKPDDQPVTGLVHTHNLVLVVQRSLRCGNLGGIGTGESP